PSLSREACERTMHVVTRHDVVKSGFDAVCALCARLPLFWIPGLLGSIPGVASAGRFVYDRVAANRLRDVPCTDLVCAIHPGTSLDSSRSRGESHTHHKVITTQSDTEEMVHP